MRRRLLIALLVFVLIAAFIPAPTAQPVRAQDGPGWQVAEVIQIELMAGPARTAAYLAPDGQKIAYFTARQMCVLPIDGLLSIPALVDGDPDTQASEDEVFATGDCLALDGEDGGLRLGNLWLETVAWSPDSRYLAMHEEFYRYLEDADLWVLDAESMSLQNLTDDGISDFQLGAGPDVNGPQDMFPQWHPDGRLIFVRLSSRASEPDEGGMVFTNSLMAIDPQGGEPQTLFTYDDLGDGNYIDGIALSPDGTRVATTAAIDQRAALYAVSVRNLDGSDQRVVWQTPPGEIEQVSLSVPAGLSWPHPDYVQLHTPVGSFRDSLSYEPLTSQQRLLCLEDGEILFFDADQYVSAAGWSPTGDDIVYLTRDLEAENNGLYLLAEPGDAPALLMSTILEGEPYSLVGTPTPMQAAPITWAANHTLLLSRPVGPEPVLLLVRLERAGDR